MNRVNFILLNDTALVIETFRKGNSLFKEDHRYEIGQDKYYVYLTDERNVTRIMTYEEVTGKLYTSR